MKEHTLLRAHLLNKFDELPVNGNSVSDWKKMEKALQIVMPIGLLSLVLFGKGWLLSKKLMWVWISIATCGGAATTLAVYQSRQASLAPASPTVFKHNPNRASSASPILAAVNDTTIRVKKSKTKKALRNVAGTSVMKSKKLILKDTIVKPLFSKLGTDEYVWGASASPTGTPMNAFSRMQKSLRYIDSVKDTSARTLKNLKPNKALMDNSLRLRKTLINTRTLRDSSLKLRKTLTTTRTLTDTSLRLRKKLKPTGALMDNSLRLRKTLTTTRPLRDTSLRLRKTLTTSRTLMDTSLRLRKTLTTSRTLMDTSLRLRKNLRPTRTLRDTLVRPEKLPKR